MTLLQEHKRSLNYLSFHTLFKKEIHILKLQMTGIVTEQLGQVISRCVQKTLRQVGLGRKSFCNL